MVADRRRMQAYTDALRRTVTSESVVLDLGAGLGAFAVYACKLGARRVFAVEPNDVIDVARVVARDNGCDGRIEFFRTSSEEVTLPERATVIVSDLRGTLPIYEHHLPSIVDARRRLLAPGGILIPQRDSLHASIVEAPALEDGYAWASVVNPPGVDVTAAGGFVRNTWRRVELEEEALLAEPRAWLTLDYNTIEQPDVGGTVEWTITRTGTANGFAVWFDATLVDGVGFSNRPGAPGLIYQQAFFPLERPVDVMRGDTVALSLTASFVGDEYVWRWSSSFEGSTRSERFRQSTLFGRPLSLEQLRRSSPDHVPTLGEEARVDLLILDTLTSGGSLGDAAERAAERFAGRYRDASEALPHVAHVAAKYEDIRGMEPG
jgi:type I protein arginine methyltransferase